MVAYTQFYRSYTVAAKAVTTHSYSAVQESSYTSIYTNTNTNTSTNPAASVL